MYKELKNIFGQVDSVYREDGWQIPFDPANTDYVDYLKWIEEGGTVLPPDEPVNA
jgi:hypothetical protein